MFLILPLPGEMIQFDQFFSDGLKPPNSFIIRSSFLAGTGNDGVYLP